MTFIMLHEQGLPALFFFALMTLSVAQGSANEASPVYRECIPEPGQWYVPGEQQRVRGSDVLDRLAAVKLVFLGEHHENQAHHRWHIEVLERLVGRRKKIVLGLEIFPRTVQPLLDQWLAGEIDDLTLMEKSRWREYWPYEPDLYWPTLHFARRNGLRVIALNIETPLRERVSTRGWAALGEVERGGIPDPVMPSRRYLRQLAASFRRHRSADTPAAEPSAEDKQRFQRFVEVQLLWDRTMAYTIAQTMKTLTEGTMMVNIIGSGHLLGRQGTVYQLQDLLQVPMATVIPWDRHFSCRLLTADFADFVYGVRRPAPAKRKGSMENSRYGERESGDWRAKFSAVVSHHFITAFHGSYRCTDDCTAGVFKGFSGGKIGLLTDHPFAVHFFDFAIGIGDDPMTGDQLSRYIA